MSSAMADTPAIPAKGQPSSDCLSATEFFLKANPADYTYMQMLAYYDVAFQFCNVKYSTTPQGQINANYWTGVNPQQPMPPA